MYLCLVSGKIFLFHYPVVSGLAATVALKGYVAMQG
jgi:hypothetical protein